MSFSIHFLLCFLFWGRKLLLSKTHLFILILDSGSSQICWLSSFLFCILASPIGEPELWLWWSLIPSSPGLHHTLVLLPALSFPLLWWLLSSPHPVSLCSCPFHPLPQFSRPSALSQPSDLYFLHPSTFQSASWPCTSALRCVPRSPRLTSSCTPRSRLQTSPSLAPPSTDQHSPCWVAFGYPVSCRPPSSLLLLPGPCIQTPHLPSQCCSPFQPHICPVHIVLVALLMLSGHRSAPVSCLQKRFGIFATRNWFCLFGFYT